MLNRIEKELREGGARARRRARSSTPSSLPRARAWPARRADVTVSGQITSYTVKGYTISSNRPGAEGSGEIRLGIEEPQPNGQLKVLSTSNPPNLLPRAPGIYTFGIGPPATGFAMPVTKGEVVSLDTPGARLRRHHLEARRAARIEPGHRAGTRTRHAVTHPASEPRTPDAGDRSSPSIPVTKLEEAEKALKEALRARARRAARQRKARRARAQEGRGAAAQGRRARRSAVHEGALSTTSQASIDFYLALAIADVRDVRSRRTD